MSSTPSDSAAHPVAWFASRVHAVLDELGDGAVWSMTAAEQQTALVELARLVSRAEALRLRVLAAGDRADLAAETAASSTAAWVAQATRQSRPAANRDVRLALVLSGEGTVTGRALAAGAIDVEQARVILDVVGRLPQEVGVLDRERVQQTLVEHAREHDATALRVLGRHVVEVLDPEGVDAALGRQLEAEELAAARRTSLSMWDNHDGTHGGRFTLPDLHAAMLKRMLHALTSPAHRRGAAVSDPASPEPARRSARPELLGQALCELVERVPAAGLPQHGGVNATVVVMMELSTLLTGAGSATLDTGEVISAGLARRLFCEAGVIPAVYSSVLGGPSQILDVGREQRFHNRYQRIALTVRDRGCTAEGCDRPSGWCHAHHDLTSWADGGGTSLENGRLLCAFHHGRAHHRSYDLQRLPNGRVRFHRRT